MGNESPMKSLYSTSMGGMMDFEDIGNLQAVYTGVMPVGCDFMWFPCGST